MFPGSSFHRIQAITSTLRGKVSDSKDRSDRRVGSRSLSGAPQSVRACDKHDGSPARLIVSVEMTEVVEATRCSHAQRSDHIVADFQ